MNVFCATHTFRRWQGSRLRASIGQAMKAKLLLCLALSIAAAFGQAAGAKPSTLPRSTPEAQGVPPGAILDLVAALGQIDAMHSFMLVRHGNVIAEGWW